MISFVDVTKARSDDVETVTNVTTRFPSDRRFALLCSDPPDRREILRLMSGLTLPSEGHIERTTSISFPVGFLGGFRPTLSLRENSTFLARMYRVDPLDVMALFHQFSVPRDELDKPFSDVSSIARNLAGYILAYSIPFDCYLLDRSVARGNKQIQIAATSLFQARMRRSGAIIATSNARVAREFCDSAAILHAGHISHYDSVETAAAVFERLMSHLMASRTGSKLNQEEDVLDEW